MVLKQYEEEYVASLEATVQSLQKERRTLRAKVQDLLAELERAHPMTQEAPASHEPTETDP
jgi:uncharacterized protein YlxW (UPF0749 family)